MAPPHTINNPNIAHPNPNHDARPAMLPWNHLGKKAAPKQTLLPKTMGQPSGVRR